jgi:hypothetical protein
VSTPTSRWVTTHFLWPWMNSIGSSTVTMWPLWVLLRWSTMAASVVDLPLPVPPTMRTSPRLLCTTSRRTGGRSSSSRVLIEVRMRRITIPVFPRWRKMLTRNRPSSTATARFISSFSANSSRCSRVMSDAAIAAMAGASSGDFPARPSPAQRNTGGLSAVM